MAGTTTTKKEETKKEEEKEATESKVEKPPPLPPLEASARRLERLFGGGNDATKGGETGAKQGDAGAAGTKKDIAVDTVVATANPSKVVRRWLGTSSGASGSATFADIVGAGKALLDPSRAGRVLLEQLEQKLPAALKEDKGKKDDAKEEDGTKDDKMEVVDAVTPEEPRYLSAAAREVESWLASLAIRRLWRRYQESQKGMGDGLSDGSLLDAAFDLSNASLTFVASYIQQGGTAATFSSAGLYPLLARLFRLRSLVVESMPTDKTSLLQEQMRPELVAAHRAATLRRDVDTQSTILNILLRDLLQSNQVEQAQKLLTKSTFPDDSASSSAASTIGGSASNNQLCRYLYHSGRIQALRLEYTSSFTNLSQALRKAPTNTALGFRIAVQRLLVVVQLLMGEIPERSVFFQEKMRVELKPYLRIAQAVRRGDLAVFNETVASHQHRFLADKTHTLISRLAHSVVKAGLRRLNVSYSRISLQDIATRLGLASATSAEYVVAKAVRDGVIDCTIDHSEGVVVSHDLVDVYATMEPSEAFHRRIAFCLSTHNDAVRGMRYPPDAYKRELEKSRGNKSRKEDEKTDEEMAKELEDELDEEY